MKMVLSMKVGDSCVNPPEGHGYTDVNLPGDYGGQHFGAAAFVTCMSGDPLDHPRSLAMVARMEKVIAIVNAHDDLVAALRGLIAEHGCTLDGEGMGVALGTARAALALVTPQ